VERVCSTKERVVEQAAQWGREQEERVDPRGRVSDQNDSLGAGKCSVND